MINSGDKIGRWVAMTKVEPPTNMLFAERKEMARNIRYDSKGRYKIEEGDSCFVCAEDMVEVLRKHHLILVSDYCDRPDINDHQLCLCENCHDLAHKLVYEERGGVSFKTVSKLKDKGFWEKFVEIDRMASKALLEIEYNNAHIVGRR